MTGFDEVFVVFENQFDFSITESPLSDKCDNVLRDGNLYFR